MGIKKNFAYNTLLTLSSYIISLIVFPHVARVLGVELLGKIDFANNFVNYFSLFSLLGVSAVGIREIAACKDDVEKRSEVFSSILSTIFVLTIIAILIYFCVVMFVPKLKDYQKLLFIGSISLFFSSLLIEWLYQGVEQFRYISVRTISVRVVYAILVFIFVRNKNDYVVYYSLTVMATAINAIINLSYSRYFVRFTFKLKSALIFIKEIASIGVYKVLTSMYTSFNVIFLGLVATSTDVGYYTTSTKLFYILLGVMTAFTGVMLPRMSALLSDNNYDEFSRRITDSFDLVCVFSLPMICGTMVFTPELINLLSGPGYDGAIVPMRLITPMIFITSIAQICVIQVLMPLKCDKVILFASLIGACIGVISNFVLVPKYASVGTAVTLLLSEVASDLICFLYCIKKKIIVGCFQRVFKYMLGSIPYIVICICYHHIVFNQTLSISLSILTCFVYFILLNMFVIRDSIFYSLIRNIPFKFFHR